MLQGEVASLTWVVLLADALLDDLLVRLVHRDVGGVRVIVGPFVLFFILSHLIDLHISHPDLST